MYERYVFFGLSILSSVTGGWHESGKTQIYNVVERCVSGYPASTLEAQEDIVAKLINSITTRRDGIFLVVLAVYTYIHFI